MRCICSTTCNRLQHLHTSCIQNVNAASREFLKLRGVDNVFTPSAGCGCVKAEGSTPHCGAVFTEEWTVEKLSWPGVSCSIFHSTGHGLPVDSASQSLSLCFIISVCLPAPSPLSSPLPPPSPHQLPDLTTQTLTASQERTRRGGEGGWWCYRDRKQRQWD